MEILVVIVVLSVLAGLLLPAVQRSRESARQVQCLNNLHQLGVATQSYIADHKHFPPVGTFRSGLFVHLLPYIDSAGLYANWDHENSPTTNDAFIPVLRCTSDEATHSEFWRGHNYLGNRGDGNWEHERNGIFQNSIRIKPHQIRDGLSKTALFAEALVGGETIRQPNRGYAVFPQLATFAAFREVCGRAYSNPKFNSIWGNLWFGSSEGPVTYDHALTPNQPSCKQDPGSYDTLIVTTSSEHENGVQIVRADGGGQWVDDGIDRAIWVSLGTRAEGD
jgi:hypothetical protein